MTIDARRILIALPLVAMAWIAILATVMRLSGDAPAALVPWPSATFLADLPEGAAITAVGPLSVTLSGGSDLVERLYASGARLVLPAGLAGCLGQRAF